MVISPEAIVWIITGKSLDDKALIKMARYFEVEVPDWLRKNITNAFSRKHVQTNTTIIAIKNFFKKLIRQSHIAAEIDELDFASEITLSSNNAHLKFIEEQYSSFFNAANLEHGFFRHEISIIFDAFYQLTELKKEEIEDHLNKDQLLSQLNFNDDLFIDLGTDEIIHNKFSMNLLLYLSACIEISASKNEGIAFKGIFDRIMLDINQLKSPFNYYVSLYFKGHYSDGDKKLSYDHIAEKLKMDLKTFSRYMRGEREVESRFIKSIIEHGGLQYFYICFWVKLSKKLAKTDEIRLFLTRSLNSYPYYCDLASSSFNKFTTI